MNLKEIAIKLLRGELPPIAEGELAKERIKVCEECPEFRKMSRQCNSCGCFLDLKTKLLDASCPQNKW
jgi:hypothetical protein